MSPVATVLAINRQKKQHFLTGSYNYLHPETLCNNCHPQGRYVVYNVNVDVQVNLILNYHRAKMRLLSFALLYCLQLQSAAQSEYQIRFQRFGSGIISLQCQYMPSTGSSQFLQINETIRYWVNITMGERPANFEPDLERRLRSALIFSQSQSEPSVTFKMSPELEGLYTCGRMDTGNNVIAESDPIYLTCE